MAYDEILPALRRDKERGLPVPALDDIPEPYEDVREVWDAFVQLNETRPVGLGAGAVSYAEIEAWLRLHGGVAEKSDFVYLVRALDRTWLKWHNEHGKTESHS